jgi:biotin transport system substrate-specific component
MSQAFSSAKHQSPLHRAFLAAEKNRFTRQLFFVLSGAIVLSLLAQLKIPLPFTPVPITGQTFGVVLITLTCGALAPWTVATYLLMGAAGLPVFAGAQAGLALGPTAGYLFGMLLASILVGFLVDRGFSKGFKSALALAYLCSLCTFAIGLPVLASFVGWNHVLAWGFFPFLLGDLIKNLAAAGIVSRFQK